MKYIYKVQKAFVALVLIVSFEANSFSLFAQDIVSTSDDISGGSSVFVFRQSRKANQLKVAFRKTPSKRTASSKLESRKKVRQQAKVVQAKKPTRVKSVAGKKPANLIIKPPKENQKPTVPQIDNSVAFANGAEEYLKRNELDKAVGLFKKSLEFNPKNREAQLGLSEALTIQADKLIEDTSPESAAYLYTEAIKLDENNAAAHAGLGETYVALENDAKTPEASLELKSKALAEFEAALRLSPELSELFAPLGILYIEKGEIAKAETLLLKSVSSDPTNSENQYFLGLVRYKQNLNQEAIESFNQAIKLDPTNANAHYYLGEVYDRLDKDKEAIASYQKSLELDPKNVDAWFDLGVANYNRGNYDKSVEAYLQAILLKNDSLDARRNLADVYRQLLKFDLAVGQYQTAGTLIERDKSATDAEKAELFSKQGYCLGKTQKWNSAIASLVKATSFKADDIDYTNLGWAYYNAATVNLRTNNQAKAKENLQLGKKALQTATTMNPKSVGGFLNLGVTLIGTGDFNEAVSALKTADELKKDWEIAKFELGFAYQQLSDWKNAVSQFKRVTELNKQNFEAFYRWGLAENSLNNKDSVKDILKELRKFKSAKAQELAGDLDRRLRGLVLDTTVRKLENKIIKSVPKIPRFPY
jgi:tetratricopeptide (TPR) repeat protein